MYFYWESYGCAASTADMERLIGILVDEGFQPIDNPGDADFIILNTCAVKLTTENRMISRFKKLSLYKKPIIVTGCLPRMNLARFTRECSSFAAALDPASISEIGEIVRRVLAGEKAIVAFGDKWKFDLPRVDLHPVIHIVPISHGCLGNCAFCGVKNVRGRLASVRLGDIVKDIKRALKSGRREIWLTSQDNGVYGWDIGTNMNELLERILSLDGDFRLRIGMMNPHGARSLLPGLIEHYNDPRVYKFAHVPVQSGSDKVLKLMNRQHTVEDFVYVANALKEGVDMMNISTDIIVGFPGEDDDDFSATVDMLKQVRPDITNVSKFYPRPNTGATNMRKIPTSTIADRSRKLADIVNKISLESNRRMIGKRFRVLASDEGRRGNIIARSPNYKQVIIKDAKLGEFYYVKVVSASLHSLNGEILTDMDARPNK